MKDEIALALPPKEINQKIVDLVVLDAVERGQTESLRVLDLIPTTQGSFLGGTAYSRNARLQAEIRIAQLLGQKDAAASKLANKSATDEPRSD